eukprot:TRINITY_DN5468_c0_g1_i1.p1 TRINITY_DN5468_c0_g1~~TRINITY_DN5468_c0_g1_i1.p1  ORF type:complete len:657 (+),score=126.38 TRINITY_DN5468_c0_g1_i1:41-2011(+)
MGLLYLLTTAVVSDVCSNSITVKSSASLGETCYLTTPCVNKDIRLDDDVRPEFGHRQGVDQGLYCRWADATTKLSGVCTEKLPAGEPCSENGDCQSRRCTKLDEQQTFTRCIGVHTLQDFATCHIGSTDTAPIEADRTCMSGSRCWPEKSNPVAGVNKIFTCRKMEDLGETCDNLWTGSEISAVIVTHTCNQDATDDPRYATNLVYCKPSNSTWRPSTQEYLYDRISSGVCMEVARPDGGGMCRSYSPSLERPACGWGSYCKVRSATDAVCHELIEEGDACDTFDEASGGCEANTRCNLLETTSAGPLQRGKCVEMFTLEDEEDSVNIDLCKIDRGDRMVYFAPRAINENVGTCKSTPYIQTCTNDTECQPPEGVPAVPVYCDRDYANSADVGTCKPVIPIPCLDQYQIWRLWHSEQYKYSLSSRSMVKGSKQILKKLACCIADETKGCTAQGNKILATALGATNMPAFMNSDAWVHLYGDNGNVCETDELPIWVIILLCVMGACFCAICWFIVIKEHLYSSREAKEKTRRVPSASSMSSGTSEAVPYTVNPLPPYAPYLSTSYSPEKQPAFYPPEPKTPANAAPGSEEPISGYAPGSEVVVWYDQDQDGFHGWFDAAVVSYNAAEDTYVVRYTTDELSEGVSSASVRLKLRDYSK